VRPEFPADELDDLGRRWRLEELYVKAYPCCRWSQGAIAAALTAGGGRRLHPGEVVRVRVFAAADGLAKVVPETTEEAQYNLVWPLACALVRGRFGVDEVLGPFTDPEVIAMVDRIELVVNAELTAAFPARRLSAVEIELTDGRRLHAGPLEAAGEPDDPALPALVADKVARLVGDGLDARRPPEGLRGRDASQLLALMCDGAGVMADG
jgi:2-methylcitrate dehydratase PrpD